MSTVSASRPAINAPARSSVLTPSTGCTVSRPNADAFDETPIGSLVTAADLDRMFAAEQARRQMPTLPTDANGNGVWFGNVTTSDDDDTPPPGSPAFPEVITWSDEELIVAIGIADRRELNLHAVGNVPDRHARFLDEATEELLRRLTDKIAAGTPALAA